MREISDRLHFQVKHIGINCATDAEAAETARALGKIFGFSVTDGKDSLFASGAVELMKSPGKGTRGHIAVGTDDIDGAVSFLERQGVAFDRAAFKYDAHGRLIVAYLRQEFSGFAVHLLRV